MDPTGEYIVLRAALADLSIAETRLEELAVWVFDSPSLAPCADALRAVKETYWQRWLELLSQDVGD